MPEFFWFEAQTGIIRDYMPGYSNYHQYKLPEHLRAEVEEAVAKAEPVAGGLAYPGGFLGILRRYDKS